MAGRSQKESKQVLLTNVLKSTTFPGPVLPKNITLDLGTSLGNQSSV